jgi:hypothetical protein
MIVRYTLATINTSLAAIMQFKGHYNEHLKKEGEPTHGKGMLLKDAVDELSKQNKWKELFTADLSTQAQVSGQPAPEDEDLVTDFEEFKFTEFCKLFKENGNRIKVSECLYNYC